MAPVVVQGIPYCRGFQPLVNHLWVAAPPIWIESICWALFRAIVGSHIGCYNAWHCGLPVICSYQAHLTQSTWSSLWCVIPCRRGDRHNVGVSVSSEEEPECPSDGGSYNSSHEKECNSHLCLVFPETILLFRNIRGDCGRSFRGSCGCYSQCLDFASNCHDRHEWRWCPCASR